MSDYTEGCVVRITALFTFDVDVNVYFEFDDLITRYGTPANDLTIVLDQSNNKKCYVDIDTFGLPLGYHDYHFYSRGTYKAAGKGRVKLV